MQKSKQPSRSGRAQKHKATANDSTPLLEAKIVIVGNGEVGKTTLMKKLRDPGYTFEQGTEPTTHGINIRPWQLDCPFEDRSSGIVNLNFWDFGGQDIYHATHQFFLTKRSLYIIVLDTLKGEDSLGFYYWLNIVKLLGADSPVIVVMNKSDLRTKHIDEYTFQHRFPNIAAFHRVSCLTGRGIPELIETIRRTLSRMPHLRTQLPRVWMDIRGTLTQLPENYIPLSRYIDICGQFGLDRERALFLSGYLHDLGVILHFSHDPLLQNMVILKPHWATGALYTLADTLAARETGGCFTFDQLNEIWATEIYPPELHPHLIRLMEKFELCFNFTGTPEYFVPELLPFQMPGPLDGSYGEPGVLRFRYRYEFMPAGMVSRFAARSYYLIAERRFWKNGVELHFEDSRALVQGLPIKQEIHINLQGPLKSQLLGIIRSHFGHIHQTLNMEKGKHYKEMVPCNCAECIHSEVPNFYEYDVLKKFAKKGVSTIHCPNSVETVEITKLFSGLEGLKPKKEILNSLVRAAHQLYGLSKTLKSDEDSRTGFISLLLNTQGFDAKDQTRWGHSASGKSMGVVDIKINATDHREEAIIEALNLKTPDRNVFSHHLNKLQRHAPNISRNFILIYAETKNFTGLWEKYLDFISKFDFKYERLAKPDEQDSGYAGIKLAQTKHSTQGKETSIYHIFVNMVPK